MSSELKKCPTGCREFGHVEVEPSGSVVCNGCGFSAPDIGTWNTRTPSPAVLALVETVKRAFDARDFSKYMEVEWPAVERALAAVEREIGGA